MSLLIFALRACDVLLGTLRTISVVNGIAESVGSIANVLGVFRSELNGAPGRLVFLTLRRKDLTEVIASAWSIDPERVYVVERFSEMSELAPLPNPSGSRTVLKKK